MPQSNTSLVEFTQAIYSVNEMIAGQPAQIGLTLKRTGNLDKFDEVQILPAGGSPEPWNDFFLNNQFAQFNPGESSKVIVIDINPDGEMEGTEAFSFELLGLSGTEVGNQNTTILEIIDDDVSYVEFSQAVYRVVENDAVTPTTPQLLEVTLTRTGALDRPADVEVQLMGGSAQEGWDYDWPNGPDFNVHFEPWQRSQTITLEVFPDGEPEGTETIELQLNPLDGNTALGDQRTATVNILDDDVAYVEFAQADYRVNEDGMGQVWVTLTRTGRFDDNAEVEIKLSGGTATELDDFAFFGPQFLVFNPGETEQSVVIDIFPDGQAEGLETLDLELSIPAYTSPYTALGEQDSTTITIVDEDVPSVEFAQLTYTVNEANDLGGLEVTLTRTGDLAGLAEVNLFVQGGSAIQETDYTLLPWSHNPVVFGPGQTTQTVFLDILDDTMPELNETVVLALDSVGYTSIGVNQTATVVIEDNDVAVVEFGQLNYVADERTLSFPGQAVLTLTRSGNLDSYAQVELLATQGSAQEGSDFFFFNPFVEFNPGETSKSVVIDLSPDGMQEGTESVTFELFSDQDTLIGEQFAATLDIRDDDVSYVEFSQAVYRVVENDAVTPTTPQLLEVTLTRTGALDRPADVEVQLMGGSAQEGWDYDWPNGPDFNVHFEPWQRSQTITLEVFPDGEPEGTETIELQLNPLDGNTALGDQRTATVNILDDDVAYVEFAQADYRVNEDGMGQVWVTLTRTGRFDDNAEVEIKLSGGTATELDDFAFFGPQFLIFNPGETEQSVVIDIFPDGQAEGLETLDLELSIPAYTSPYTALGDQDSTTITIVDEAVPSVEFAQLTYTVNEANDLGGLEVTLTRTGDLAGLAEVNLFVQGGSAIQETDYTLLPWSHNPVVFGPGQTTQTVFLDILDDTMPELNETVVLALDSVGYTSIGVNQTATVVIEDNDVTVVEFGSTEYSIGETGGQVVLTLTRSGNLDGYAQAELIATGGNAQEGSDFFLSTPFIEFNPGEASKSVVVDIFSDSLAEGSEAIAFELISNTDTLIGEQYGANLVIIDPGTNGPDTIVGSETDDVIKGKGGNDVIQGLGGKDRLEGNGGKDFIDGGAGNDIIKGGNGNDDIEGGSGNDFLNGQKGDDFLKGGLGNDTYTIDSLGDIVEENVNSGTDHIRSSVSWSLSSHVENLTLTGSIAIEGVGNSTSNILKGNKRANQLEGLAGNDILKGQNGDDTLIGVDQTDLAPGQTEIDTLIGGQNADLFILGNTSHIFYDDGEAMSQGLGDYALINDFKVSQQDRIQLKGSAADYRVGASPLGTGGKAIFYQVAGETDELIAVVKGTSTLDLNSDAFDFV
ncbi:MAG: Calx-beta domain-containing protein [Cyanobacteria bacterium J06639_14]